MVEASGTEKKINEVGELYRPSAERAAFFFIIVIITSHPCKINPRVPVSSQGETFGLDVSSIETLKMSFKPRSGWCFLSYLNTVLICVLYAGVCIQV